MTIKQVFDSLISSGFTKIPLDTNQLPDVDQLQMGEMVPVDVVIAEIFDQPKLSLKLSDGWYSFYNDIETSTNGVEFCGDDTPDGFVLLPYVMDEAVIIDEVPLGSVYKMVDEHKFGTLDGKE